MIHHESNDIATLNEIASIAYQAIGSNSTNYLQISNEINEAFTSLADHKLSIIGSPLRWYLRIINDVKLEFSKLEKAYHEGEQTIDEIYSLLEVLIRNAKEEFEQRSAFLNENAPYEAKVLVYPSTDPRAKFKDFFVAHVISLDIVVAAENKDSAVEQCFSNIQRALEKGFLKNCLIAPPYFFSLYENSKERLETIQKKSLPRMKFHILSCSIQKWI